MELTQRLGASSCALQITRIEYCFSGGGGSGETKLERIVADAPTSPVAVEKTNVVA